MREDIEQALKEALERHRTGEKSGKIPANLLEVIKDRLLAPEKRIRSRLALTCSEMVGLYPEAALPTAMAVEILHCSTLLRDAPTKDGALTSLGGDALLVLALDVFMEAQEHVGGAHFSAALRRLIDSVGPRGTIGGQAAEKLLTPDSKLSQLEAAYAQKTGALYSASLMIPKDLIGITDDCSQGLALESFARELGFASQVADDLETATEPAAPQQILHYLPREEAQSMTLRRLNAACTSMSSIWGKGSEPLVHLAQEIGRRIQDARTR